MRPLGRRGPAVPVPPRRRPARYDAVIVGGGIAGLTAAFYLTRAEDPGPGERGAGRAAGSAGGGPRRGAVSQATYIGRPYGALKEIIETLGFEPWEIRAPLECRLPGRPDSISGRTDWPGFCPSEARPADFERFRAEILAAAAGLPGHPRARLHHPDGQAGRPDGPPLVRRAQVPAGLCGILRRARPGAGSAPRSTTSPPWPSSRRSPSGWAARPGMPPRRAQARAPSRSTADCPRSRPPWPAGWRTCSSRGRGSSGSASRTPIIGVEYADSGRPDPVAAGQVRHPGDPGRRRAGRRFRRAQAGSEAAAGDRRRIRPAPRSRSRPRKAFSGGPSSLACKTAGPATSLRDIGRLTGLREAAANRWAGERLRRAAAADGERGPGRSSCRPLRRGWARPVGRASRMRIWPRRRSARSAGSSPACLPSSRDARSSASRGLIR